eukprot:SAG31_NODE_8093_length_1524_cov_1.751579_2_plen_204_part_00
MIMVEMGVVAVAVACCPLMADAATMSPVRIALYCSGGASSCPAATPTCCEPQPEYLATLTVAARMAFGPTGFSIENLTAAKVVGLEPAELDIVVFPGGSGPDPCAFVPCEPSRHHAGPARLTCDCDCCCRCRRCLQATAKPQPSVLSASSLSANSCPREKATSAPVAARSWGSSTLVSTFRVRGYFLVFVPTIREIRYFYREM